MRTSLTTKKHTGGPSHSHAGREEQQRPTKEHKKHHEKKHSSHSKRHKRRRKRRKPVHRPVVAPRGTIGVAPVLPPISPPAPSSVPPPTLGSPPITLQQANRLLWRAGFGPTPGQAEALVGQPLQQVVFSLTRP